MQSVAEWQGRRDRSAVGPPWHVAHVIGALRTGGAERQLVNYLLAADKDRFRHTVLCLTERGALAPVVEAAGVTVRVMPVRQRAFLASLFRFRSWLRENGVAVVHTHMHHAALWGRLAAKWAGVPVLVTTEHGKELWKGPVRIAIDRWLSCWTDHHIAVSRDGLELRRRRERVSAERIVLIPNGVPIPADPINEDGCRRIREEFGIPWDAPVVGTVGRLVEAKGYHHLLDAVAGLHAGFPALRWLLVGDGPLRRDLAEAAQRRGLESVLVFAGFRDDIDDLLSAMDVWVMSSLREGLPVALLEAMAAARPIVATTVGGIPDAVTNGESALLVPPGDPEGLRAAIGRLLTDPGLARALAREARRRAEREYAIEAVARRIERLYLSDLEARVGKPADAD